MNFGKVNPFALRRGIVAQVGEVRTAKALRSGALLVRSSDQDQSNKLLNLKSLCNIEVQCNQCKESADAPDYGGRCCDAPFLISVFRVFTHRSGLELFRDRAGKDLNRVSDHL